MHEYLEYSEDVDPPVLGDEDKEGKHRVRQRSKVLRGGGGEERDAHNAEDEHHNQQQHDDVDNVPQGVKNGLQ